MNKRTRPASTDWLRGILSLDERTAPIEERQLSDRWGVARCSRCGRTILLGERVLHLHLSGRPAALCPDCAARMRTDAFRRAA